jgi:uncharacterized protein YfeS
MTAPDVDLSREDAHPRAREALVDAFFWDAADPCGPFGDETGREVLEAFRDYRVEEPRGEALALLADLLATWEVADDAWDVVDADAVQAIGADDELGLLLRDEAIVALAFAQIIVEGRVDPEVQRRAVVALTRQSLPALLHAWGERRLARAAHVERMRAVLGSFRAT